MTTTSTGVNLWATKAGQTLQNNQNTTKDIFHAVYDNVRMNGGGGGDHFHIKAGTTGATIEDFRYGEGDLIVLDGLTSIDRSKFAVTKTGEGDYTIKYDKTTFKIENLRDGQGNVWNISGEKLLAQLFPPDTNGKYVRLGQIDAMADYNYGLRSLIDISPSKQLSTEERNAMKKTFQITGDRPVKIVGFYGVDNFHQLAFASSLKSGGNILFETNYAFDGTPAEAVRLIQDGKVLAYLTSPRGNNSRAAWQNDTYMAVQLAAIKLGLRVIPTEIPSTHETIS